MDTPAVQSGTITYPWPEWKSLDSVECCIHLERFDVNSFRSFVAFYHIKLYRLSFSESFET